MQDARAARAFLAQHGAHLPLQRTLLSLPPPPSPTPTPRTALLLSDRRIKRLTQSALQRPSHALRGPRLRAGLGGRGWDMREVGVGDAGGGSEESVKKRLEAVGVRVLFLKNLCTYPAKTCSRHQAKDPGLSKRGSG